MTQTSSRAWYYFKTFVGAIVLVVLIPVVSGAALWFAITYYPEKTGEFMEPLLKPLVSGYQAKDASALEVLNSRVDRIERDLEDLQKSVGEILTRPAAASGEPGGAALVKVDEKAVKLLSALDSLTVARVEYTMGNRGVALREVRLAQELLGTVESLPEDVRTLLDKAASELTGDSPAAGDWLSVLWHAVVKEACPGGP